MNYSDIELQIAELLMSVEDGEGDAIVALADIIKVEKLVKEAKAQVYEQALSQANEYPEKTFEHKGLIIEKRAGRKVYDFKGLPEWVHMNSQVKDFEKKCKGAFDHYQKGLTLVDEVTSEQIPIPGVKTTADVLVIKNGN